MHEVHESSMGRDPLKEQDRAEDRNASVQKTQWYDLKVTVWNMKNKSDGKISKKEGCLGGSFG